MNSLIDKFVLDNEGNKVRVGDIIIGSIHYWRGKEEVHRGVVTAISKTMCTADFKVKGIKRVKNTKFIKVFTLGEINEQLD